MTPLIPIPTLSTPLPLTKTRAFVPRPWWALRGKEVNPASDRANKTRKRETGPASPLGAGPERKEVSVLLTEDIYLGAFGLVRGGELRGVAIRGVNGRRMAVFSIEGKGMDEAEREYFAGSAVVNLQMLKFQVRRLKDRAFEALREEERRRHAGEQGRDRAHQAGQSHRGRPR